MLFTVTVDLPGSAYFEFSSESLFEMAEIAKMLGNTDVVEEEDEDDDFEDEDYFEIPEEIAEYFDDGEEYTYDEDADVYCWYDEEHEAWYWLNVETGEWVLVEDVDGYEVEAEEDELEAA
jgi:hypothetical protein